jgi:hypothetical protein
MITDGINMFGIDRRAGGTHEVLLQVGYHQPPGAEDARRIGYDDLAHAQTARDVSRMQRSGAAKRHEGELTWVVAAFDGNGTDRPYHVGHHNAQHTVCGTFSGKAESLR